MSERLFPNSPINPIYAIAIWFIVISSLFINHSLGITVGPVEWLITVIGVPILFIFIATWRQQYKLTDFLSLRGDLIFALSMVFLTAGVVILVFWLFIRPISLLFVGTSFYNSVLVLYPVLSAKTYWFATIPITASILFYVFIGIFEEFWKIVTWKNMSNFFYSRFRIRKNFIIIMGLLISFIMWLSAHWLAWSGLNIFSISFGIALSIMFMLPYWLFGDRLISPESGIQLSKFSIYGPIAGHAAYDIMIAITMDYPTMLTTFSAIALSVIMLAIGGGLLVWQYYKAGHPLFSFKL